MDKTAPNFQNFRERLKLRHLETKSVFEKNHPHAKSFFDSRGLDLGKIRRYSAKLLASGAIGGALLLSPPKTEAGAPAPLPEPIVKAISAVGAGNEEKIDNPQTWLVEKLTQILPPITDRWALPFMSLDEEKIIGKLVERATGIPARASLEGEHLNTVYGYTGAEQHLFRFPGDTIEKHDEFREVGIAPGLGGYGYFTEDGKLTSEGIMREKYYVAVQTLYLPDWEKRLRYLVNWYKWRKIIMVNVENGNAAVAVVGDAGPASWTGKHFGGSPEVMNALGGPKYKKGRALLYFVDDPENKIPLGPIDYAKLSKQDAKITLAR